MPVSSSPFDAGEPADDYSLRQELSAEVTPDEKVLWSGYPQQGVMLQAQDIFMIPFSLLWGGFAIFWEYSAVTSHAPLYFDLFGLPFVLIGLYLIVGRFFADSWARAKTIYAVTNRRVLIVSGLWQRNTRSLELPGLSELNITEKTDGRGTITFGPDAPFGMQMRGWPGTYRYMSPSFDGIARARDVLGVIRDAQRAAVRP